MCVGICVCLCVSLSVGMSCVYLCVLCVPAFPFACVDVYLSLCLSVCMCAYVCVGMGVQRTSLGVILLELSTLLFSVFQCSVPCQAGEAG